jgi:hypothetical protein
MDNRRHFHRYLLHTEIKLEHESLSDVTRTTTKDISRGGICITTEGEPLEIGTRYGLKFLLPFTDEEIAATAQVKWNRPGGALFDNGLLFIDIDEKYLDLIEEYSIGSLEEKNQ